MQWEMGVFASIDAGLGVHLDVAKELGVPTVQLHAPHAASRTEAKAKAFLEQLKAYGLRITAVFGGFEGESYADIPTCVRTVGLVPEATRAARLAEMMEIAQFARVLGVDVAALHLGFVPHDVESPHYRDIVQVTRQLCDYCKSLRQSLHLETGQETADSLLAFIHSVDRDNLFVNFDPANMILYGSGDPIEALRKVGSYVRSVHCKDGKWAAQPGKEWGQEVPLGEGDVGMERYLTTLKEIGYDGPLTVERETPQDRAKQKAEIGHAIQLLTQLRTKLGV